ncbi:MAG: anthranilate phosphoribosyltransferase [Acidobacteriaceae bacterium]
MGIQTHLRRVMEGRETLGRAESRELMERLLKDPPTDAEIAALLGALAARGETPEEIAGFVEAMRATATTLPLSQAERDELVDTCGTGGDASGSFNISTAAALVSAAAGAKVAKHGNRAVTSKCGSADVLEALGVPLDLTPAEAADSLRRHGFAFLHAPALHPAMRVVMPVRRALGVRTVFNLFGPLSNPAGASRQVMGVYGPRQVDLVARTMALLGTKHALVVHGEIGRDFRVEGREAGIDEISISGRSLIAEVRGATVTTREMEPEDAGLKRAAVEELRGDDPATNASILRGIFAGETGARRDVVVLNAAAVLMTAGLAGDIPAGVGLAERAIDTGAVRGLLVELTGQRVRMQVTR